MGERHGIIMGTGNHGWFIRIEGWRQLVLLLAGLAFCYGVGVAVGGK